MRLQQLQQQSISVELSLSNKFDKILSNRGTFALPSTLAGKVSDSENIEQNRIFGKLAAQYMSSQIKRSLAFDPELAGKTILYYGYAFGDDRHWIPYAMHNQLYVEIRDVSNLAVKNAEKYSNKINPRSKSEHHPCVFLDDLSNIKYLDNDHVQMVYACRVLGLVRKPYNVLRDIGKSLFRKDNPGQFVVIQSFDDLNKPDNSRTMTVLNKQLFLSSLEQGAGQKLSIVNEKIIDYYHKKVTAVTVEVAGRD